MSETQDSATITTPYCGKTYAIISPEKLRPGDRLTCGYACGKTVCGALLEVRQADQSRDYAANPSLATGAPTGYMDSYLIARLIEGDGSCQLSD